MKRTLIVLGIFLILFFLAHKSLQRKENRETHEEEAKKMYTFGADAITEIELKNQKGKFDFKKSPDSTWKILEPINTEANNTVLKNLSEDIVMLQIKKTIKDIQVNGDTFGLGVEATTISFHTNDNKQFNFVLGSKSPDKTASYLKKDSDPALYLVETNLDDIKTKDLSELREKSVFHNLKADDIRGFTLQNEHGHYKASFDEDKKKWILTEPIVHSLGDGVAALLSAIVELHAQSFITEKADPDDLKKYGLQKPAITMSFDLKTKETITFSIAFNKNTKGEKSFYFHSSQNDVLVSLDESDFNTLNKTLADLVDKKLVNFESRDLKKLIFTKDRQIIFSHEALKWYGTTPVKFITDQTIFNNFLNTLKTIEIMRIESIHADLKKESTYGFTKPIMSVDIEDSENNTFGFMIGRENAQAKEFYVKKYNDPFIYTIKKEDKDKLFAVSVENVREEKLVTIPRWNITEMSIPEKKIRYVQNTNDTWQKYSNDKLIEKDSKAAVEFLEAIDNLKVTKFSFNTDLKPYEFDKGFTLHIKGKNNEDVQVHFGKVEMDKAFVYRADEGIVLEVSKASYEAITNFFEQKEKDK